jgi:hypothetical protein
MSPKGFSTATLLSTYDRRHCVGFVLLGGKMGFELFDRNEKSCGLFARGNWRLPRSRLPEPAMNSTTIL